MQPSKTQSIGLGAIVGGVLGLLVGIMVILIPNLSSVLGIVGCLLVPMAGAFAAVWHFTNTHQTKLSAGEGAGLGAAALAVGSLISSGITLLLQSVGVLPNQQELMKRQMELAEAQWRAQGLSDSQIEQARQTTESMTGMFSNPILGLIAGLAINAVVGAILGAVAAALFKPKQTV